MSDSSATPWTEACQAPLCMEFPRQEYHSGLPFPSSGLRCYDCGQMSSSFGFSIFHTPRYQPQGPRGSADDCSTVPAAVWVLSGMLNPHTGHSSRSPVGTLGQVAQTITQKRQISKSTQRIWRFAIGSLSDSYGGIKVGHHMECSQERPFFLSKKWI